MTLWGGLLWLAFLLSACQPVVDITVATPRVPETGPPPTRTPPTAFPVIPRSTRTPVASKTPTPASSPTPAPLGCWREGGRIEIDQLYTDLDPYPFQYRVYIPPCYDQLPDRRYPSLYLIHGSTFSDDQWDRLGIDETADRLITLGEIPPLLIIMPRDRIWKEPDEDPFGRALTDHILPWIETQYRTLPDRDHRAIGGLSRGAAWAVHLGLSRWDLFGALGAHSLPVFWSDTGWIRTWLDEIPPEELPRIYLDIGEEDYLIRSAVWFEGLLTELEVPHEWYLFPGRHEEAYWQAHLESYLRWYTSPW